MADMKSLPAQRPKRRWLRISGIVLGVLILLLVAAYFTVTSSAFVKGVILPRAGKVMNATVTASDASVNPFSQIVLRNLKVQTTGEEPLLTAGEVRLKYHLFAILRGNVAVDEITLESPVVNLVRNADGSSNLDPLTTSSPSAETKSAPAKSSPPSKPLQMDLKKLSLVNGTIRQIQMFKNGGKNETALTNVNVTLDNLKNGATGKLQLSALANIANQVPAPASLQTKIDGDFEFTPDEKFKSVSAKGNGRFDVQQAGGAMKDFAGFDGNLNCDITPSAINQLALKFQKSGQSLGEIRAAGPFDMAKTEGRLNVEILALDRRVLDFFGASSGIDFGGTTINSTNTIELTKSSAAISANGNLAIANLQLIRAGQSTPTLNAELNYDVAIDSAAKSAVLHTLNLSATQNGQPLAHAALSAPMNLSWNGATQNAGESAFNVSVTGMNLADWKPFIGENLAGGNFSLESKLLARSGGKQIEFNLNSQIGNLAASFGSNKVQQANLTLAANGSVADFKQFKLDNFKAQLAQQNQTALTISGSGTAEPSAQTADLKIEAHAALPELLKLLPQPDANFSSGTLDATANISQKGTTQTIAGKLSLASLTGKFGGDEFQNYGADANFNLTQNGAQIQAIHATGNLTANEKKGGNFDVSANYDDKKNLNVTARLDGFNENGLRPFLASALGDKKLVSISLNGNASVQLDAQENVGVKAYLKMANLIVNDPSGQIPATPLAANFQLDVAQKNKIATLNQVKIALTPTGRAKNELQLSGVIDLSKTNAMSGNLKLIADSLDVTRYYDLFAAKKSSPAATAAPQPDVAAPAPAENPGREPEAMHLPFGVFTVDATIGKFYLREIGISNLTTTAKINGSHVVLNPCKFTLNGGPVSATADLNLGVPGYEYNAAFNANGVPVAPLANSFSPDYSGKAKGDLFANVNIKGAGMTGINLKRTLAGNVDLILTNAMIDLNTSNAKDTRPQGVSGYLMKGLGQVVSILTKVLKLDEITTSPLTGLDVHAKVGGGKISATSVDVGSAAFQTQTAGTITIANVLTNSTINDWPVHLELAKASAQRLGWVPPNAPASQQYFALPDFLTVKGTIGAVDPKPDYAVVGVILARSGLNIYNDVRGGGGNAVTNVQQIIINKAAKEIFNLLKKK
ncbi:MAG TPA: AsmA family protein [Verrucomicrobiae bacterium]|nr:AsmA family protein [Verrucomicrobiae bacterium]